MTERRHYRSAKVGRRRLLGWLAALILLGGYVLRNFEANQVYHPGRAFITTGKELGRPFAEAEMAASDGVKLHGWFYPAETNSPLKDLAVLVCHGNAGNISHRLDLAGLLAGNGLNVLLLDYRGYGKSEGKPSEEGTYLDAVAAHEWLARQGFAATNIVVYGESLGGGVAAELALRKPVAGLVLQSTFTSIPDIGAELFPWLPVRWISRIRYDTHAKLSAIRAPVMVVHSREDRLVRFHHAERNFAAANQPKMLWELTGDHNDGLGDPEHFNQGLRKFLALVTASSPAPSQGGQ